MRFDHPHMLWWIGAVPFLAVILRMLFWRKRRIADRFIESKLWDQAQLDEYHRRERMKAISLMAGVFFGVMALARPQWGQAEHVLKRKSLDILIAVDVSKSMLTRDVRPSRLERTQWAIKDLVKKLTGDRVGLMAFAGEAFVMCPLTLDYNGFLMSVDDLSPQVIPRGGTNLSKAIDEALRNYGKSASNFQVLVLVTDGDELEGDALAAARRAREQGVKVFTVGVGTQAGDLIEITDDSGGHDFLKDAQGNVVKSRLNENLLQRIAYETQGAYVRSSPTEFGLDFLYEKQLSLIPKRDLEATPSRQYHDRYQWPLTVSLVCFMLPLVLSRQMIWNIRTPVVVLGLLALNMFYPLDSYAKEENTLVRQGNRSFNAGDFPQSIEFYEKALKLDPGSAEINYNLGSVLYKNRAYSQALKPLMKATGSENASLAQKAFYNLGLNVFKYGLTSEETNLDQAIDLVEQSIVDFQRAITLNPKDKQAIKNKKIAEHELQRLKEKKKQQQQQQNKGQSQDGKQGQNKDQQQSHQQQQGQSQEGQEKGEQKKQDNQGPNKKDKQQQDVQGAKTQQEKNNANDTKNDNKGYSVSEEKNGKDPQKKEAEQLLEEYQRSQEPQGILYLMDRKSDEQPVSKDW